MSIIKQEENAQISKAQINDLVDRFYKRVHEDERLGPIFASELSTNWDEHTDKMKAFWRSILLKTREYNGRPVPKHQKLVNIETDDFVKWLSLFQATAYEVFEPSHAQLAIKNAENIASSLWLAMNKNPFDAPPDWASYN